MRLGDKLKEIRMNRGYSQQDAAEMVGVSRYLISKYENNISIPRGKTLLGLARFYKVNVDYLLNDSKETLIDYYSDILDESTKSKINPFLLDDKNKYFSIDIILGLCYGDVVQKGGGSNAVNRAQLTKTKQRRFTDENKKAGNGNGSGSARSVNPDNRELWSSSSGREWKA